MMNLNLFSNSTPNPQTFELPNADITYYPNYLSVEKATNLFHTLLTETPWQHDDIKVFGKTYPQPRLTALYATNTKPYSYSNIIMYPHELTSSLSAIKQQIDATCNITFSTMLLNLYRDGKDSNGWHADNEPELGKNPIIASLSLGSERKFKLKHRTIKDAKQDIVLTHGSLLIMKGETQHFWLHQIPKTAKKVSERINITFRIIT